MSMGLQIGQVFWITGLSGAGKTTLACQLAGRLREHGRPTVVLDGDELRTALAGSEGAGFGRHDRLNLGLRYARLANVIAGQEVDVVVATISMFNEVYEWNRSNVRRYVEIFVDVPIGELRRRDKRGVYDKADDQMNEIAGIGVTVDTPAHPTVHLEWRANEPAEKTFERLFEEMDRLGGDCVGGNR
jgi:cytidine diphosphoramidate kinase